MSRLPDFSFPGATAVVTGAASGIGEALAHGLAARGAHPVLVDRDAARLEAVAAALRARHPGAAVGTRVVDLADAAATQRLGRQLRAEHPALQLLVNNAGIALGGRFEQLSLDDVEAVMAVNFHAPLVLTHTLLPALRAAPGSHLVNVSSLFGLLAPAGQSAYAASKFALRGLTEALRHELPASGTGVTAVHPGGVRTRIAESARTGAGVDPAEAAAGVRQFSRLLRLDPALAAGAILEGVRRRRPRVLVGGDAVLLDAVARLLPSSYGRVLDALVRAGGAVTRDRGAGR